MSPALKALAKRSLPRFAYTVRHGRAHGLKRRGGFGFLPTWIRKPSAEDAFVVSLDLRGKTVWDVGGFEGVYTIFFARAVGAGGRVVVFEPNVDNRERILENVALNGFGNVDVVPVALGARTGATTLFFDPSQPGTGFLESVGGAALRRPQRLVRRDVRLETIDAQVAGRVPEPDFVKIDVEGAEADVLVGARRTLAHRKPTLLIEIHGDSERSKVENARNVLGLLAEAGYMVWHIESGQSVTAASASLAREGHLYCT